MASMVGAQELGVQVEEEDNQEGLQIRRGHGHHGHRGHHVQIEAEAE